ncbi:hypothetical protein GE115_10015 [Agromyces sp. CFH 90414]|uniref:NTP pyrophosphohydrolase n=1 Tax=Agromyces agglutinans TaxID=2662258 RepID=A0A6I2F6G7_9MICO|nr:hypothetical protein [Agromyces agglutinans]MRG60199.1 hypothetical protein [Agromyces agglutinans]
MDGSAEDPAPAPAHVVVDVANVMGSRPDGWWKDRAGAAERLLSGMPELVGRVVTAPDDGAHDRPMRIQRVVAVLEGRAKAAATPVGIEVVLAPADGDSTIAQVANELAGTDSGPAAIVVTADRGLRARLAPAVIVAGQGWLNALLGR